MYEIKSPESKGTRYKDWATTGTISKIYFHVYYLVAPYIILVTCNILTKREVLHCTPFYVCSQGGQSPSNSYRFARELEELLPKRNEEASSFEHLWVRTIHFSSIYYTVKLLC